MGTKSRERRARVIAGLEPPRPRAKPLPVRYLTCKKCHTSVPEYMARPHIRECWGYPIKEDEPIPVDPILPLTQIRPRGVQIIKAPPGPLGGTTAEVKSDGNVKILDA